MVILMKIKRRKIKKGPLIKLIIVILLLILIIVGVKKIIYLNSDEYKLKEIGYNKKQIIEIYCTWGRAIQLFEKQWQVNR